MHATYRLLPLALSALLTAAPALAAGPNARQPTQPVSAELEAADSAMLLFMREEERLARDVYLEMDVVWEALPPFANIAVSEQQHMDAIKTAMDAYGLDEPSDPDAMGIYSDAELQGLYDQLIERGGVSYTKALEVGALIEEVDIEDLQLAIEATDNIQLQGIYDKLLRGSRNHLRAFVGAIERQGQVYEAQYLDQTVVDAIVDSPMERGGTTQRSGSRNRGQR